MTSACFRRCSCNSFPDLQEDWDTNPVTYHYNTRVGTQAARVLLYEL
jgi:hypothetical protein